MNGLILAAGYGTRLKEYGEKLPKGLIPYKNTVLVERVITEFLTNNITGTALITNDKYKHAYETFVQSKGYDITVLSDGTKTAENHLGGLADLWFAVQKLGWIDRDILVAPSDTYVEFSFSDFLSVINKHPQNFCTIVRKMDTEAIKGRLGCATIKDGQITAFVEKPANPPSPFAAIPFYYYPSSVLPLLNIYKQEGNTMDAPGSIVPWLLARKLPVYAYTVSTNTIDVGTMNDVQTLQGLQ
jgi:NDP-sugar pyrophosphorylase family protein